MKPVSAADVIARALEMLAVQYMPGTATRTEEYQAVVAALCEAVNEQLSGLAARIAALEAAAGVGR